jgi:hypothetical protein
MKRFISLSTFSTGIAQKKPAPNPVPGVAQSGEEFICTLLA